MKFFKKDNRSDELLLSEGVYSYWKRNNGEKKHSLVSLSLEDALVFSLSAGRYLKKPALERVEIAMRDFILMVNERFYSDCCWLLLVEYFVDLENIIAPENHFVSLAEIDGDGTYILINHMNICVFDMLEKMGINIFSVSFTAYHPGDINDLYEAEGVFDKNKMELEIYSFYGRKAAPEIRIVCNPSKCAEIRQCIDDVFFC